MTSHEKLFGASEDFLFPKKMSATKMASLIASEYKDIFAFHKSANVWLHLQCRYPEVWLPVSQEQMEIMIHSILLDKNFPYPSKAYTHSILVFIKPLLSRSNFIPAYTTVKD